MNPNKLPQINIPLKVKKEFEISVDFITTLVKMVDYIRENDYSDEAKAQAVEGLDLVIKAVKSKYGDRVIMGTGGITADPQQIANGVLNKVTGE